MGTWERKQGGKLSSRSPGWNPSHWDFTPGHLQEEQVALSQGRFFSCPLNLSHSLSVFVIQESAAWQESGCPSTRSWINLPSRLEEVLGEEWGQGGLAKSCGNLENQDLWLLQASLERRWANLQKHRLLSGPAVQNWLPDRSPPRKLCFCLPFLLPFLFFLFLCK